MTRFVNPSIQYSNDNGSPLKNGSVEFLVSNGSAQQDVYSNAADAAAATPGTEIANPVLLDGNGRLTADVFLQDLDYKTILRDSDGVQIDEKDPVNTGSVNKPTTTNTLTTLKALNTSIHTSAVVLGHTTIDDGGGGHYHFDSGSAAADNNGTIIAPDVGSGRWLYDDYQEFTVNTFGANVSATSADNNTAIQACVDALNTQGGGDLIFLETGAGTYSFDGAIALTGVTNVLGQGYGNTQITLSGLNTGTNGFVLSSDNSVVIKDIRLTGNWDGTTPPGAFGEGVSITTSSNVIVERCIIEKWTGAGIKNDDVGINLHVNKTVLSGNGLDGLWNNGRASPNQIGSVRVTGGTSQNNRRSAFRNELGVLGFFVSSCHIFGNPIIFRGAGSSSCEGVVFSNCRFEDNGKVGGAPFWIKASGPLDADDGGTTSAGTGDNMAVINNQFASDSAGRTVIADGNVTYEWVLSGSGTNEYYVQLSGGGDPSLASPNGVVINGLFRPKQKPGNLGTEEWGHGDNDTLGFNTVYVRLADGTDPDTKASGFVTHQITWEIPSNTTSISNITQFCNGPFPSLPSDPAGANDPKVTSNDDREDEHIRNFALAAFPNGVERRLAGNIADAGNAGIVRALVYAFNASSVKEEVFMEYDGSSRKARFGSDDLGTVIEILSTALVQLTSGSGFKLQSADYFIDSVLWGAGSGSPEGVKTAPVGSIFSRTDGGAGTSFYVKESGVGNTGWVAK